MKSFLWLKGLLSSRYRAMSIYRQGMKHAQRHNHQQAIADYTLVIEMNDITPDIRSMALYNRALVYSAVSDQKRAIADLQQVLVMGGTSEQVRTEARRKIARMQRSSTRSEDTDP